MKTVTMNILFAFVVIVLFLIWMSILIFGVMWIGDLFRGDNGITSITGLIVALMWIAVWFAIPTGLAASIQE